MNLKTYRAHTMAQALAEVKKDLGSDAVILHTRSYKQGGVLGFGARQVVEITAARGQEVGRMRNRQRQAEKVKANAMVSRSGVNGARSSGIQTRQPDAGRASASPVDSPRSAANPTAGDLIRRTYAAARAEIAGSEQSAAGSSASPAAVLTHAAHAAAAGVVNSSQQQRPLSTASLAAARQNLPSADAAAMRTGHGGPADAASSGLRSNMTATSGRTTARDEYQSGSAVAVAPTIVAANSSIIAENEQLAEEMRLVRQMMGKMMRSRNRRSAKNALPQNLFDQYMHLIKQELADELAEDIIEQVGSTLEGDAMGDDKKMMAAMRKALAAYIPVDHDVANFDKPKGDRPRTIALVGPTGVGKTTTIAKLAATFKLKHKKNVGLITIDTYRIAAVEQLRTYANIIKLPLHVVMSPEEMSAAMHKLSGCDVILVDTAGRSQRDDPKLDQLADFIRAAKPHETHLVLSSTASQSVMEEIIRKFARLNAHHLIFTKLDEAVAFGTLVNVARRAKKQLSFVTTGQEVPHQIEAGCADRLASLMLGEVDL